MLHFDIVRLRVFIPTPVCLPPLHSTARFRHSAELIRQTKAALCSRLLDAPTQRRSRRSGPAHALADLDTSSLNFPCSMHGKKSSHDFVAAFIFAFLSFVVATAPKTLAQGAFADAISKAHTVIQMSLAPKSPGLVVAVAVNDEVVSVALIWQLDRLSHLFCQPVTPDELSRDRRSRLAHRFRGGRISLSAKTVSL